MKTRTWLLAVAAAIAAGCSGLKTYSDQGPKNIHVSTRLDPKVRAALHVHEVTGPCTTRYEGTVALDQPTLDVGVAPEHSTYLVVSFDTSSFLGGSRSTSVATVMDPRSGYAYELAVSYRQDIYNVVLREIDRRKGVIRELPRRALAGC